MPLPNFLYIYLIINRILAKRRVFPTSALTRENLDSAEFGLFSYAAIENGECLWNKERLLRTASDGRSAKHGRSD